MDLDKLIDKLRVRRDNAQRAINALERAQGRPCSTRIVWVTRTAFRKESLVDSCTAVADVEAKVRS